MRCPKCGKQLESKAKLCPNCNRPIVASRHQTSVDSPYSDVIKPRSKVSVRGIGSKMTGPSSVKAVRHKIAASNETASSQKLRCFKCGTVNGMDNKSCRNCGARIAKR